MDADPSLAVVIPAYNAARTVRLVLERLQARSRPTPIVVVDAGSSDDTSEVARELGARVVRLPRREGPAGARNAGVAHCEEEVVLFLDADCVPHDGLIERVRAAFAGDPQLVALTGSYDADPPAPGFFSQYMNLRHHFVHQRASRDDATFWAGCGAVRRAAFLRAGGFDSSRYARPQIEDIELAVRLRREGRLRLDPDLQVTHLKGWSMRSVVMTDIFQRALPWARLILETGRLPNDLNLKRSQRVAALVAPISLAALTALPWAAWRQARGPLAAATAVVALSLALNLPMIRFFADRRGVLFAAGGWLFHQVHLTYSLAAMAWCAVARALERLAPPRRDGGLDG